MEQVEVVVAHHDCATLRVGDLFLKIDADQARTDTEAEAMARAPVPTPQVRWRKPPVLALAALPGTALGRLGDVVAGYRTGVDLDVIRAWWSLRSLRGARWLIEHGFGPSFARLRVRRAEIAAVSGS